MKSCNYCPTCGQSYESEIDEELDNDITVKDNHYSTPLFSEKHYLKDLWFEEVFGPHLSMIPCDQVDSKKETKKFYTDINKKYQRKQR